MKASQVHLPQGESYTHVFSFLVARFPHVSVAQWIERLAAGQVWFSSGEKITLDTPYQGGVQVWYYKTVANEQPIPFQEVIVYEDERILVACKPHFLAVLPAGRFVQETLLSRLQAQTQTPDLSPAHRIDRGTAGLVLFCKQPQHRGLYQNLFKNRQVQKEYLAVCHVEAQTKTQTKEFSGQNTQVWKHQIIKASTMNASDPWFAMAIDAQSKTSNAETQVRYLGTAPSGYATFSLRPITGRKHQLRVQLAHMGYPIVNDPFYPRAIEEGPDCFDRPLQLLADKLSFVDPVTQATLHFQSTRQLKYSAAL